MFKINSDTPVKELVDSILNAETHVAGSLPPQPLREDFMTTTHYNPQNSGDEPRGVLFFKLLEDEDE